MRIVAGRWRGRRLVVAAGIRPTQGGVREALFSRLAARVQDVAVVDLFAGSGSLGLEALSRGARSVLFVERSAPALEALRANIAALGAEAQAEVTAADVFGFLSDPRRRVAGVGLLFADPPYGGAAAETAEALGHSPVIGWAPGALRAIECGAREALWSLPPGWLRWPARGRGDTQMVIEEREE